MFCALTLSFKILCPPPPPPLRHRAPHDHRCEKEPNNVAKSKAPSQESKAKQQSVLNRIEDFLKTRQASKTSAKVQLMRMKQRAIVRAHPLLFFVLSVWLHFSFFLFLSHTYSFSFSLSLSLLLFLCCSLLHNSSYVHIHNTNTNAFSEIIFIYIHIY